MEDKQGTITNPVLPGFHPDPSIVRVGKDFYLATSTFEWFPGVALYHSRDLKHWRSVGHALTRSSQINLTAVPDSGGIWAPSLSHANGKFWLVYTVMRTRTGAYKDMVNALVTADSIEGPWSDPVILNARGFDPSLFHDDDGRKWLVQILWDHRKSHPSFGGIVIQEYDPASETLIGSPTKIFEKSVLIEGPNLYRRNGFYYLMLAEGGTSWNHAVTMARSRNVLGPYETDPQTAVLTSRDAPALQLQKAGHGELVSTAQGEWFLAHLASRPLITPQGPRCPLGRETCLQNVIWSEHGWLRLAGGGIHPRIKITAPVGLEEEAFPKNRDSAHLDQLGPEWCSLRRPITPDWADPHARPGWLRVRGQESPCSLHDQSLIARRVTSTNFRADVIVDFQPLSFQHMAGLIFYYDTRTHFYLRVTRNDSGARIVGVVLLRDGVLEEWGDQEVEPFGDVHLAGDWQGTKLQFSFRSGPRDWQPIGPALDASELSDDFGTGLHFTGAFVGVCAQDLDTHSQTADFSNFQMVPLA
jgi:xylan 1,4-beta-xylosidase